MTMGYDHRQALSDLIGQIRAMKERSEKYEWEERTEGRIDRANAHVRVLCVLRELERLGHAFEDRASTDVIGILNSMTSDPVPPIGHLIIDEIIKQSMVRISYPDPEVAHLFVWSSGAAEQLEAVVERWVKEQKPT